MKVIIAGGGIGGLTTAAMLATRGIACELFEQSPEIREVGVGINTLPHAIKELAELGMLPRLDEVGIRTHALFYCNRFGQVIWNELRGTDAGFEYPQFSIHRGRLQGVIHEGAEKLVGRGNIHTGARLVSWESRADGVTARFVGPDGTALPPAEGDVLVGADGIHSVVRSTLFPDQGPPSWNGIMMWRGAIDWPSFMDGRSMIVAGGMREKVVLYPIGEGTAPDRRLTNWVVCVRLGDGSGPLPSREDWSRPGRLEEVLPHAERFSLPAVDLSAIVRATPQSFEYPMCDRDPLPRWTHGRVTLLGDAAHPMYPVGSNGASQAILDARCLADCLAGEADVDAALAKYEAERLPKTAEIVRLNRGGGPEGVIDAIEALAPDGFEDIEQVLPRDKREAIVRGYASIAGFTSEQVNLKRA